MDPVHRKLSTALFAALPFATTLLIVGAIVQRTVYPLLSGDATPKSAQSSQLPLPALHSRRSSTEGDSARNSPLKRLASLIFSSNIGFSAVLAELILCEISNAFSPATRSLAVKFTIPSLLVLLIIATPALEIHSIFSRESEGSSTRRRGKLRWMLEALALAAWLLAFWYLGKGLLGNYLQEQTYLREHSFSEGCLERIGIIGIALMASLAGFAAISTLWQTWGPRQRKVTDTDIARKQSGIDATNEMLATKRSRLRALQHKIAESPTEGFMTRVVSSIRGNPTLQESQTVRLEIAGLETMRQTLQNSLFALQTRRQTQQRSATPLGRFLLLFNHVFSVYCLYRICTTFLSISRRVVLPSSAPSAASTDPVTHVLSLLARHWDPSLDRAAWSRQISLLLSVGMLLASVNSALQTFLLFARAFPAILATFRANLALLVSQVAGTYVISSALLLRSNLPKEVGSGISAALGAPLEVRFVERWFEGWFLAAAAATVAGIWIGRKMRGQSGDPDLDGDLDGEGGGVELGKMS